MSLLHDVRLVLRALARAPGFALVAVLSVALGVGANVAVFGLVNALLLRPLPVPDADRLVRVGRSTRSIDFGTVSLPEYRELRDGAAAAAELVAHRPTNATVTVRGEPRPVWIELVSANYFSALRVPPLLGRGFGAAEDGPPGTGPAVVVSHAFWRRQLGADPAAVGATVRVNGRDFTVVGVAPPSFGGTFTGVAIDAWVPVSMQAVADPGVGSIARRDDRFLMLVGRLRDGVAPAAARAALAPLAEPLRRAASDSAERVRLDVAPATGVHPFVAGVVTAFLGLLQGVVLLLLLVTCVNLASVLLARAAARRRELAVRAALGGGRWRLARLLLAESLVLAAGGGAVGLLLALWVGRLVERVSLPVGIPLGLSLGLDARVALAAVAATLATALAFGAGPAVAASRADAIADLRAGAATADRRRARTRAVLVGAQVMLATVLLVGSLLLLRSLRHGRATHPGFDAAGVHLVSASPEMLGYDEARGRALWADIVARAERVPGVRAATLALFVPLGSRGDLMAMAPAGARGEPTPLPYNFVTPGHLATLRVPIVAGRDFRPEDDARAPDVVVLGAAMARRFFGEASPLGRAVRVVDRAGGERVAQVVGVAADVKLRSLGEPPRPIAYFPFAQRYRSDMVLHLRVDGRAAEVTRRVAEAIHAAEPDLALEIESMTRATGFALVPLRVAGTVLGVAGAAGLFLASLGVFGLVAYAVSQRVREIGIRMALGARRGAVTRLVAVQGLRPVLVGLALGLVAAAGAARLLRALLVGVGPSDPATLGLVAAVLLLTAAAALVGPLRRALVVDPARVLRSE